MECNPDFSEDIHSKEILMLRDEYLIEPHLNEEQSNEKENQKEKEKDIPINQIIDDESFEKAFNQIFLKKTEEIEAIDEPDHPLIKIPSIESINITPYLDKNIVIKVEEKNEKIFPFPFTMRVYGIICTPNARFNSLFGSSRTSYGHPSWSTSGFTLLM